MSEQIFSEFDAKQIPRMLYGTAWKEDETRRLVELALSQGFRGIDTANQRKHYFERAVGEGIATAIQDGFCLLYTSPSPRDRTRSRMPSSA